MVLKIASKRAKEQNEPPRHFCLSWMAQQYAVEPYSFLPPIDPLALSDGLDSHKMKEERPAVRRKIGDDVPVTIYLTFSACLETSKKHVSLSEQYQPIGNESASSIDRILLTRVISSPFACADFSTSKSIR